MWRHFDAVTEATRHEIRLVAEAVTHLDEKFERKFDDLKDRMDHGFSETQAMMRVERIESTH